MRERLLSFGDTNVGLIVSNPSLDARKVKTPVVTSQVAVTILEALGIDSNQLDAEPVCCRSFSRMATKTTRTNRMRF
jgi:arylsulfatase A-like enzyme